MIRKDHYGGPGKGQNIRSCRNSAHIPELTDIITADPHFLRLLADLPLYAESDLPVLLTGEPGTGKELIANGLCALSTRWHKPYYRTNCAALTESLACSELFGHMRGAFTGALAHRTGKFKLAHQGTLLLDEVGDLPLSIQPLLLRAVEQGEIEPVGGDVPIRVDVRLIAATNQDLPKLIARGVFRQDLYDRLAVLEIHLSPLRERAGDIMLLARHFARETGRRYGRARAIEFTPAARRRLMDHSWPGNARELKNVVTRAVLFSAGDFIQETDLFFNHLPLPEPSGTARAEEMFPTRPSRGRLEELLGEEGGNISALSRRLKVCSKTIYRWLRFHDINMLTIREKLANFAILALSIADILPQG